jgi:hypothetical protein
MIKPQRRVLLLILLAELLLFFYLKGGFHVIESGPIKPTPLAPAAPKFSVIQAFTFMNDSSLKIWEEKIFKGKTIYTVVREKNAAYLKAFSEKSSSGLYLKSVKYQLKPDLYLNWTWRAVSFPKKEHPDKLSNREEDDFAARVYVVFPGSSFFSTNVIEYIWDEKLPTGSLASSPFSGRVKLFVIRSGKAPKENEGWVQETRDLYKDYKMIYGKEPDKELGAIAFMSDSDNTQTASEAHLKEITFTSKDQIKEKSNDQAK